MLWELAHLPTLPTTLVQQALEEHLGILSDAYAVKETVKRSYIIKCIEDIKKVRRMDHRWRLMQRSTTSVEDGIYARKSSFYLFWRILASVVH